MSKLTEKQQDLVNELMNMNYGQNFRLDGFVLNDFFPPSRRPTMEELEVEILIALNTPRSLFESSLPEEKPVPIKQLMNELDGSFVYSYLPDLDCYDFHRLLSHCPRCQGRGFYENFEDLKEYILVPGSSTLEDLETFQIEMIACDHRPFNGQS